MPNRAQMLPVVIGAGVVGLLAFGVGTIGAHDEPANVSVNPDHPTAGPDYEAAMDRCALSRLRNAGIPNPSEADGPYLDARNACTLGTSYDDVGSERGWGAADPDYWTP